LRNSYRRRLGTRRIKFPIAEYNIIIIYCILVCLGNTDDSFIICSYIIVSIINHISYTKCVHTNTVQGTLCTTRLPIYQSSVYVFLNAVCGTRDYSIGLINSCTTYNFSTFVFCARATTSLFAVYPVFFFVDTYGIYIYKIIHMYMYSYTVCIHMWRIVKVWHVLMYKCHTFMTISYTSSLYGVARGRSKIIAFTSLRIKLNRSFSIVWLIFEILRLMFLYYYSYTA